MKLGQILGVSSVYLRGICFFMLKNCSLFGLPIKAVNLQTLKWESSHFMQKNQYALPKFGNFQAKRLKRRFEINAKEQKQGFSRQHIAFSYGMKVFGMKICCTVLLSLLRMMKPVCFKEIPVWGFWKAFSWSKVNLWKK